MRKVQPFASAGFRILGSFIEGLTDPEKGWKHDTKGHLSKMPASKLKTSNESDDSSPCWTAYRQDFEDPWQLTLENMHLRLRKTGNPITTLPVRTKSPIPVHEEVAVVVNKKPGFQHHSTSTVFGAFRGPEFPWAGINLFSIPKEIKTCWSQPVMYMMISSCSKSKFPDIWRVSMAFMYASMHSLERSWKHLRNKTICGLYL